MSHSHHLPHSLPPARAQQLCYNFGHLLVPQLYLLVQNPNHCPNIHLILYLHLFCIFCFRIEDVRNFSFQRLLTIQDARLYLSDGTMVVPLELFGQFSTNVYFVVLAIEFLDIS